MRKRTCMRIVPLSKARVDASFASAALAVAESERQRISAWVSRFTITAPHDGVVVARSANIFDFVQPSPDNRMPVKVSHHVPNRQASPLFVIDRVEVVRVFVDIPEQNIADVHVGTKASVVVKAYGDEPIQASVCHVSQAVNVKSRTLLAPPSSCPTLTAV